MGKRFFVVLVIFAVLIGVVFASSQYTLYLNGAKTNINAIVYKGNIYIKVTDIAKIFPSKVFVYPQRGRIDIQFKGKNVVYSKLQEKLLWGEFLAEGKNGLEFPLKGVKVYLFSVNPSVPKGAVKPLVARWIMGKGEDFLKEHGKVREGISDKNGFFYIENPPKGEYWLIGVYTKGNPQIFWIKKVKIGKAPIKVTFKSSSGYGLEN